MCGGGVGRPGFQLEPLQHLRGTSGSPHPCVSRQPGVSSLSLSVGFRGLQGHDATTPINPRPPHQTSQHLNAASRGLARRQVGGGGEREWLSWTPAPPLQPQRPRFWGGGARLRDRAVGGKELCFLEGGDQN